MANETTAHAEIKTGTPPPVAMLQMLTGYWVSQALYAAAKLGIADLIASGTTSAQVLAEQTGANESSLHRLLRALASVGVFTETNPGSFALTPLAELLRTGTPRSMHALALMYNEEQYRTWGDLMYSVRTGEPAFEQVYGMPVFQYFETHPEVDATFNAAMTGLSAQTTDALLAAYDFSPFSTIADIGGGHGNILTAILRHHPSASAILFDQPHVVATADLALAAAGIADRCQTVGGDFFTGPLPAGADAYLLSQILHDWDDEHCLTILRQLRQAIPNNSKLLILELVLKPGDAPDFGKWLDLHMLVMNTGRERTAAGYDTLLRPAGFTVARVIPTNAGPAIIEAVPI
jgi:hypothetical protein